MAGDTIKYYLGKMVIVKTRMGRDGYPTYVGKVSDYDEDFITLNPYTFRMPDSGAHFGGMRVEEVDKRFKAGTTDSQITINRKTIDSIEALVFKE